MTSDIFLQTFFHKYICKQYFNFANKKFFAFSGKMDRIIALVDMDCFYVQVEQRLQPEYKGKPCAVVQYKTWKGGGYIIVLHSDNFYTKRLILEIKLSVSKCYESKLMLFYQYYFYKYFLIIHQCIFWLSA